MRNTSVGAASSVDATEALSTTLDDADAVDVDPPRVVMVLDMAKGRLVDER